ncbi:hypothetical protein PBCV1_A590L [Paramecium bursaria Chlorella virus 1]|uniref:F-box domain-containing protein n=1 Tax=Paramecium bursaria Chlorella virus 1 TaxID=10506 RepID=O41072_PBCV1|nr:hypothetical protein PBCV1_A590L [Paramecium bursaria Chlorella virus 1]AAC96933.2 hypothetical protein [Paramecium bursaria Chlorella virus 1]
MNDYIIDHSFDEYINTMMEMVRLSENLEYYEEMFDDYSKLCISCGRYPYVPSYCDTEWGDTDWGSDIEDSEKPEEPEEPEEPEIVSLDILPNDILEKLPDYLDNYGDLVSLSFVNKTFNTIFSKHMKNKTKEYHDLCSSQLKYIQEKTNELSKHIRVDEDEKLMSKIKKICHLFDVDIEKEHFEVETFGDDIKGKHVCSCRGDICYRNISYYRYSLEFSERTLKLRKISFGTFLKVCIEKNRYYFYCNDLIYVREEHFPTVKELKTRIMYYKTQSETIASPEEDYITTDEQYENIILYRQNKYIETEYKKWIKRYKKYLLDGFAILEAIETILQKTILKNFSWEQSYM